MRAASIDFRRKKRSNDKHTNSEDPVIRKGNMAVVGIAEIVPMACNFDSNIIILLSVLHKENDQTKSGRF